MSKEDGGPAFPSEKPLMIPHSDFSDMPEKERPLERVGTTYIPGMSLRDWFAGQALEEDVKSHMEIKDYIREQELRPNRIGKQRTREQARYHYADAMLKERQESG